MRIRCLAPSFLRGYFTTIEAKEHDFSKVAEEVSRITRTRPRWEQTLLSDYPSFDFSNPSFLRKLLKHQNNAFLSLRFFLWLKTSDFRFSLDSFSCNALFKALIKANACIAAKGFLEITGFNPQLDSLECYVRCLCDSGFVEHAIDVFGELKRGGLCPSAETWNSVFLGCLRAKRNDLFWQLYKEMMESGVGADVKTVGFLIQAFCDENQVFRGYELLRQVLEDGFRIKKACFNKLLSGFSKEGDYERVSELLHMMIETKHGPDIYAYQEVINGLCKNQMVLEAFRVFNDLKDRGYAPHRVMYTTMIHGLCSIGCVGDARKLWFEMIRKGYLPNEYTYNSLIHGFCKIGEFRKARKLCEEMCDKGYGDSVVNCTTMTRLLCLEGRTSEAYELFVKRGLVPNLITYNGLIRGFCNAGNIEESINLLKQLLAQGLQPSTASCSPLIKRLCRMGDMKEAKKMWHYMINRGLEPSINTWDVFIRGHCDIGDVDEGMEWFVKMLKNELKPKWETFEGLIWSFFVRDRLDCSLLIVDYMLRTGYRLRQQMLRFLVLKLCQENRPCVETVLDEILEKN